MIQISRTFKVALKMHDWPAYRLAIAVGMSSSTLSRLIHGVDPIKEGDPRIVDLGRLLNLSEQECFERVDPDVAVGNDG